jgi:alkylation response protein AidB-like acyl-CoA dehydrogenase
MLNEQQTLITEAARRFVRERIIDTKLDQTLDQSGAFPHDILRELWTQGLVNLEFPEAVGGPALSCHDHVLVLEELNYGCLGIGTSAVANSQLLPPWLSRLGANNHNPGRTSRGGLPGSGAEGGNKASGGYHC